MTAEVTLSELRFDEQGLVPVAVQDQDGQLVMIAFANREAIELTIHTGQAHYYSRSRQEIWLKGATSGHYQSCREIRVNCDNNSLLYLITRQGPGCHTGEATCYYRQLVDSNLER